MSESKEVLLQLRGVKTFFPVRSGFFNKVTDHVQAVNDVDLDIYRGETLGLVGESGCGKTTLGKSIIQLVKATDGTMMYDFGPHHGGKKDLRHLSKEEEQVLHRRIQIVFQDPYSSLDPRKTCGKIVEEPMIIHKTVTDSAQRQERVRELMSVVGLDAQHVHRFPHEFSGGQRQRINIARALSLNPDLLVCDEPVSALDVSIQAQVLNLFGRLQEEFGLTYVFISHDLSVIKHISDRIAIMYLGQVVELCGAEGIYDNPLHPYTRALLSAVPPSSPFEEKKTIELKGDIPSPIGDQVGCPLASRCPHCTDRCRQECPSLKEQEPGHQVACFLYES